jgi:[methyl-Co(III) methanol-specific corrinoid protein]:coenzyme M methyltransferase
MSDSPRANILALLQGTRASPPPCFSGLSAIIAPALAERGLVFHEIHHDAGNMVIAAASAYELYGWQSATLPTHLVVEAEALGAEIDFRADMPEPMWPLVAQPLFATPAAVEIPRGDFAKRGSIPRVCEALRALKTRGGENIPVGAFVPGPFTLAMQVVDYNTLLPAVKHSPHTVARALDAFADVLIAVANAYHNAGADFLTIHEMGGSPGVVGPRAFEALILPRLQKIIRNIPPPSILSVCGNTNHAMHLLARAGANALSVDQTNDLARSRAMLGRDVLLFGNLDPVRVIAHGTPESIRHAVQRAVDAGADAIMPGCDLYFQTPAENLRALVQATTAQKRSGAN